MAKYGGSAYPIWTVSSDVAGWSLYSGPTVIETDPLKIGPPECCSDTSLLMLLLKMASAISLVDALALSVGADPDSFSSDSPSQLERTSVEFVETWNINLSWCKRVSVALVVSSVVTSELCGSEFSRCCANSFAFIFRVHWWLWALQRSQGWEVEGRTHCKIVMYINTHSLQSHMHVIVMGSKQPSSYPVCSGNIWEYLVAGAFWNECNTYLWGLRPVSII